MLSDNVLARHVWDPRLQSPYCKQNSARRRGELYTLEHSQTSFLTAYLAHGIQGNPGADLTAGSLHRYNAGSSPWTPTCEPRLTRQQCDWSISSQHVWWGFSGGAEILSKITPCQYQGKALSLSYLCIWQARGPEFRSRHPKEKPKPTG